MKVNCPLTLILSPGGERRYICSPAAPNVCMPRTKTFPSPRLRGEGQGEGCGGHWN